jgi:hypothetical protein
MLAGKDRHFGAKTAIPSAVFQEAVKAEALKMAKEIVASMKQNKKK